MRATARVQRNLNALEAGKSYKVLEVIPETSTQRKAYVIQLSNGGRAYYHASRFEDELKAAQ